MVTRQREAGLDQCRKVQQCGHTKICAVGIADWCNGSVVPEMRGCWLTFATQATDLGGVNWAVCGYSAHPVWGHKAATWVPQGSRVGLWVLAMPHAQLHASACATGLPVLSHFAKAQCSLTGKCSNRKFPRPSWAQKVNTDVP